MLEELKTRNMPGHNVGFAKKERYSALNGLFTRDGLRGLLEGADFR